jgi:hypothetical protein
VASSFLSWPSIHSCHAESQSVGEFRPEVGGVELQNLDPLTLSKAKCKWIHGFGHANKLEAATLARLPPFVSNEGT